MLRNGMNMYRVAKHIMGKDFYEDYILLNTETGYYYELNRIGTQIWQMILEGHAKHAIVDALVSRYGTPQDEVERDLQELVDDLKADGILEEIDASASDMAEPTTK